MAEVSVATLLLVIITSLLWKTTWGLQANSTPYNFSSSSLSSQTLLIFFTQTNGDSWKVNTNWTTPDVCTWYGVECSPSGDIIGLSLPANNLSGKLGVELSEITTLQKLDLSGNSIRSPIPYSFGSFPLLTHLDLSSNYLFGVFPPEFSKLAKLSFLNLSCNFLSETLPNAFFSNVKELTHFDVHDNDLSGEIPNDLNSLTTLEFLDLSENDFTGGVLPLLTGKPLLTWISLRKNLFIEPIPFDFSDGKPLLSFLDLSENNFWGELPALTLDSLTTFIVSDNNIGGQLPNFSGIPNIQVLDLSRNSIEGLIPFQLYGLVNLVSLDLSQNRLSGTIASDLNQLVKLQKLSLSQNGFSGNLPILTSLTNLRVLRLQQNHLSGVIPGSPNTPLIELDLSKNKFSGNFPESLCNLEFLEELDLSSNQLSGAIPNPCFRTNLRDVDLSSNFLENVDWATFYSGVQRLSLSLNSINLNWSTCVPSSNAKSSLLKLDLDHNMLQGNVVDALNCFSNHFPFLSTLNLAFNKLIFPQDAPFRLPQFSSLDILNLSSNNIEGMASYLDEIYLDIGPFVSVDLSHNPISGALVLSSRWNNLVNVDISFTSISPCVDSSFFTLYSLMSYRALGMICTDLPSETSFAVDPASPWTNGEIICPRWKFPNGGLLDVDGAYFDYSDCNCVEESTYWDWTSNLCVPCPEGLMCSTAVVDAVHTVLPGYYPVTANGTYETNQTTLITAQLLVCNSPTLCNPRRSASFECAPGRDLDSLLCSKCDTDYYTAGDECWPCMSEYVWAVPVACFALMGFGLAVIWSAASKPGSPTVQIVVFWLQLTMILEHTNRLGPGISNTNPWTMLANFSWIQTITNLQPWAFECTWPTFDYVASFWIMLIIPLSLLIIPMLTHFVFWIFSFCSPRLIAPLHWQTRIWFVSLFLLNLFYFPVNQRFLEVFNCSTEAGITYLVAAPWIRCEDSMYTQMRLGAIIGLLFYLPLWPLWCTYQLLFKVDYVFETISENKVPLEERSPEALQMQSLQFLWGGLEFTLTKDESQPFTDRVRYLWLVLGVGGRKFILALILSLIPRGNIILPLLLLSTLGLTIAMNLVVKPYANPWHNYLEIALLSEVFFTFITGTLGNTFDGPVDLIVYVLHGVTLFGILILATRGLWQCFLSCQQKSKSDDDVVNVSDVFSDYLSIMTYKDTDSRR